MRLFFNENNSYNVIEKLLKKECDICLITMNASALSARASLFAENNIVCEILAEDFIVSCFNNLSKYASNDMTFPNNHCIIHLSELEKYNNYFYDDSATSIMRFDDILSVRDILKKKYRCRGFYAKHDLSKLLQHQQIYQPYHTGNHLEPRAFVSRKLRSYDQPIHQNYQRRNTKNPVNT